MQIVPDNLNIRTGYHVFETQKIFVSILKYTTKLLWSQSHITFLILINV